MLKKRFLEILKTNGIKENYAKVLYYLIQMDGGEACCKDVSEALNLPKQRVGDALRYLEKEKLIARTGKRTKGRGPPQHPYKANATWDDVGNWLIERLQEERDELDDREDAIKETFGL